MPNSPLVLVHIMPWFSTTPYSHWGASLSATDGLTVPERYAQTGRVASHFTPLIGPYESNDPDTIALQMDLLKQTGVDGIIVDWYGASGRNDYAGLLTASDLIIPAAVAAGLLWTVCYEDRTVEGLDPTLWQAHLNTDMQYIADTYPAASMLHDGADGRTGTPVLLTFGPMQITDQSKWTTALTAAFPTETPRMLGVEGPNVVLSQTRTNYTGGANDNGCYHHSSSQTDCCGYNDGRDAFLGQPCLHSAAGGGACEPESHVTATGLTGYSCPVAARTDFTGGAADLNGCSTHDTSQTDCCLYNDGRPAFLGQPCKHSTAGGGSCKPESEITAGGLTGYSCAVTRVDSTVNDGGCYHLYASQTDCCSANDGRVASLGEECLYSAADAACQNTGHITSNGLTGYTCDVVQTNYISPNIGGCFLHTSEGDCCSYNDGRAASVGQACLWSEASGGCEFQDHITSNGLTGYSCPAPPRTSYTSGNDGGCYHLASSEAECCGHFDNRPAFLGQPCVWGTASGGCQPESYAIDNAIDYRCGIFNDGNFGWPGGSALFDPSPTTSTVVTNFHNTFYTGATAFTPIMGSAFPMFKDYYTEGSAPGAAVESWWGVNVSDLDGQTLQLGLSRATANNAHSVQIATFNDWQEGTAIEPSYEKGFKYLLKIQQTLTGTTNQAAMETSVRAYYATKNFGTNCSAFRDCNAQPLDRLCACSHLLSPPPPKPPPPPLAPPTAGLPPAVIASVATAGVAVTGGLAYAAYYFLKPAKVVPKYVRQPSIGTRFFEL